MTATPKPNAPGRPSSTAPLYGRGSGNPHPVDIEVGRRIRARRLYLGMNQEALAKSIGLTFQQVQKYEGGANRVSASRLAQIAAVLDVDVPYFFATRHALSPRQQEMMSRPEAIELVRYFRAMTADDRFIFLDMVKAAGRIGA